MVMGGDYACQHLTPQPPLSGGLVREPDEKAPLTRGAGGLPQTKIKIFKSDAEIYETIRDRVRLARVPLRRWECNFLDTYYLTPQGINWKNHIDGDFREKFGVEDDLIEVEG